MSGRAIRRHHVERLKKTRYSRWLALGWPASFLDEIAGRLDDVYGPRRCSCPMCTNKYCQRARSNEERRWQRFEQGL